MFAKILVHKKSIIITLTTVLVISIIAFPERFYFFFNKIKYDQEVAYAKKIISYLAESDANEIRKRSTKNAYFIENPVYLSNYEKLLSKIDIDLLHYRSCGTSTEKENPVFIVEFYYDENPYQDLRIKLVHLDDKWLLDSVMFSDIW